MSVGGASGSRGGSSRGGSVGGGSRGGSTRGAANTGAAKGKTTGRSTQAQKTVRGNQITKGQQAKKTGLPTKDVFEAGPTNQKIKNTVAQLNPQARYKATAGQTFCNRFAADYASRMGDPSLQGKTANQQYDHLNSATGGYRKATAAEAMKAAAEGKLAFAAYQNPTGHGHIAAVVGETAGKPAIAQAGRKNYDFVGVNYGFTKAQAPSYFVRD